MHQTIPVMFTGGAYGTYIEYLLNTWTSQGEQTNQHVSPFTDKGNAHAYVGHHLVNMAGWREYLNQKDTFRFVRFHPKTNSNENISNNIAEVSAQVNNAILIEVDSASKLLVLNNYYSKIWDNWEEHQFNDSIDISIIYKNWPVKPNTPLKDIPKWILREFFSYYLIPAWEDLIKMPKTIPNNVFVLTVSDILTRFSRYRWPKMLTYCGLTENKDITSIHATMLSTQKYVSHQRACDCIIDSILHDDVTYDYSEFALSFIDEVYLQHMLRGKGIELKCDGLNQFPSSTKKLLELIA